MAPPTSAACARSSIRKTAVTAHFKRLARLALTVAAAGSVAAIPTAHAARYLMPKADAPRVGETLVTRSKYEDTLAKMAQRYGVGYRELVDANPGVDPWLPGEGTPVVLPTEYLLPPVSRDGVVLNLPEFRLYYFPKSGAEVVTFPIGIGRSSYPTPKTDTRVLSRVQNPTWYPGENARREYAEEGRPLPRFVPAGPDNPMGSLALVLGIKSYFIHGTNKPFGVGQQASFGCIRLYPADIEDLGAAVPNGTRVRIIDVPTKVAWVKGELYLEVHKDLEEERANFEEVREAVLAVAGRDADVDWSLAEEMARDARGIPGPISIRR
jgi:L,D-transpeptidase ErfK/SrfK